MNCASPPAQTNEYYGSCPSGQAATAITTTTLNCATFLTTQTSQFFSYGSCPNGQYNTAITTTTLNCSIPQKNSTFWFVNSGNLVVNNHYYGLSGSTNTGEIIVSVFCPIAGYFTNLAFQLTGSPGTGAAVIITLDRNTIAQSLQATCANPATTCVDNTHSVFCAGGANNYVDYQLTETGVVTAGLGIGISVDFTANGA